MDDIYLSTESLSKHYRGVAANDNITVRIPRGRITGFIGRNGSGKTTMIRLLTGLAVPTSGKICFSDADAALHTGAIVENPAFFGGMTARENVVYEAKLCGVDPRKADEFLRTAGLDPENRRKVKNYSLGMKQRLGIAIALVNDPEFLILDEPTNGLDPQGMIEMRDFLHALSREKGVTILVSSHLLGELERIADRYIFIDSGKIVEQIDSSEVESRMAQRFVVEIASDPAAAKELLDACVAEGAAAFLSAEEGTFTLSGIKDYNRLISVLGKLDVREMRTEASSLEKYYLERVGE